MNNLLLTLIQILASSNLFSTQQPRWYCNSLLNIEEKYELITLPWSTKLWLIWQDLCSHLSLATCTFATLTFQTLRAPKSFSLHALSMNYSLCLKHNFLKFCLTRSVFPLYLSLNIFITQHTTIPLAWPSFVVLHPYIFQRTSQSLYFYLCVYLLSVFLTRL